MSKISDSIRIQFMEIVKDFITEKGFDVLKVKNNTFSIPWVKDDEEGYINITFSIPKGQHGINEYDGFEEAKNYEIESKAKAEKKADAAALKAKKIKKAKEKKVEG
jgi:hypothetical protein